MAPQLSDAEFDAALQQRLRRDPSRFTNIMEHLTGSSPTSTHADLGASATPQMGATRPALVTNTPRIAEGHTLSGLPWLYGSHPATGLPPQGHLAQGQHDQMQGQGQGQGQRQVGHNHAIPNQVGQGQGQTHGLGLPDQSHGQVVQNQAHGQVYQGGNAYAAPSPNMAYPTYPPGLPIPGMQSYQAAHGADSGVASALPTYRQMPFAPPSTALQVQGTFPHASQMLNGPRTFPGLPLTKGGAARAKSKKAEPVEPKFGKTGSMVCVSEASFRST